MPSSFNVMEAFVAPQKFEGAIPIYLLRDERDHLFSLSDFFDYLTSSDGPKNPVREALRLPEGVVHSYTPTGSVQELTFLYGDGTSFVIGGFALIRYGTEVNWILLGGPCLSEVELNAARKELIEREPTDVHPRKKFLAKGWTKEAGLPVLMEGTEKRLEDNRLR